MKHYIKFTGLLAIVLLSVTSCKKSFFSNVNENLNAPDSAAVIPSSLLPTVQLNLAYTVGGDISRFTSLITQQTFGFSRQAQGYYTYVFTSTDFDSPWGNLYTGVMENNYLLIKIADSRGDNAYSGVGRILMAYTLQMMVDLWGPIPYTDAFHGGSLLRPKFDDDQVLYDTIVNMLNTAITQVNSPNSGSDIATPGNDDLLYAGDMTKWTEFAHALLARIYIHQSKVTPALATNALDEANQSFTSNDDNATFIFGATEITSNPWYQFNEQRADIDFSGSPLATELSANNDPRYTIFTDPNFNDVNGVGMGAFYGSISSPVEFVTYDEMLFVKAEAILRSSGDFAAAQTAYQDAITANMQKLGVAAGDITTYLGAHGTLPTTSVDAAISQVATEEYTALYLNPEAFTLYRRTGAPALPAIAGTAVPRRFLYPQNEYSANGSNTPSATLFTPTIFWDQP
jgi:hypothetical protein